jgi:hypothetical protein
VVQRPYAGATVETHRQQRRIEARDVAPPGYALAHLAAGGVVTVGGRPAVVDLSVRNLLNAAYRDHLSRYKEFAQAMGRAVVVRVTVGW